MSDLILPGSFDSLFGDMGVTRVKTPPAPKSIGCEACGRQKGCKTPKFPIYGNGAKGILIVSEVPGPQDDEDGIPLAGESGTLLRRELKTHGIDLKRDCWVVFAVRCHDPKNALKTKKELHAAKRQVMACIGFTGRDIQQLSPKVIIASGNLAIQAVLHTRTRGRMSGTLPSAFIGRRIPDQEYKAWVCATESPERVMDQRDWKGSLSHRNLQADIKAAVDLQATPVPEWTEDIRLLRTPKDAIQAIQEARRDCKATGVHLGIDLETSGLKPHRKGHKIACASMAWETPEGQDKAIAFPMFPDPDFLEEWKGILTDPDIEKGAHNHQFEQMWISWLQGFRVAPWGYDSQIDAHIIDCKAPTNLKFCVYTDQGIIGYDDEVDKYLESSKEEEKIHGANAFNQIDKAPIDKLLLYNARDSLYMHRLRRKQIADLKEYRPQIKASRFFLEASEELSISTEWGMCLDETQIEEGDREAAKELERYRSLVMADPIVKAQGPGFSLDSRDDLPRLVYDVCGYKSFDGKRSVDKEHLEDFNQSTEYTFAEDLVMANKYQGIRQFFAQYRKHQADGVLHGVFGLSRAPSFRGNHSDPNLAAVPKRDKISQKFIRSAFKPRPGNVFLEADFSGVEVAGGCCYHKDPVMVKYVTDPTTGMHSDAAMDLFFRDRDWYYNPEGMNSIAKQERQAAKNGFVFPSFYGSSFAKSYLGIWKQIPKETKDHLAKHGIKDKGEIIRDKTGRITKVTGFAAHVKAADEKLWKRFAGYAQWRKDMAAKCDRDGYIELYTGFRCKGPLAFTESGNWQVQGSSYHILLWTYLQVGPIIRGLSGRSSIVLSIHDALVVDAHPDEVEEIARIIKHYGEIKSREHFRWINVPLKMELEISEIDGTWAKMKNYHLPEDQK